MNFKNNDFTEEEILKINKTLKPLLSQSLESFSPFEPEKDLMKIEAEYQEGVI